MPIVIGMPALESKLMALAAARRDARVIVGYSTPYAVFVHENTEIHPPGMLHAGESRGNGRGKVWDPQGIAQPKFLEGPARTYARELGEVARLYFERTKDWAMALLAMGLRLQALSQPLVPVDTGFLKNSAFTELEKR